MPEQNYIRPPIVQAVLEVRFSEPADIKQSQKFIKNIAKFYPTQEEEKAVDVSVDVSIDVQGGNKADVKAKPRFIGYKVTSLDRADVALVRPDSLAFGRLAPYEGWSSFSSTIKKNWEESKKIFGYRQINRLALRYINRIDIPFEVSKSGEKNFIEETDYLNISIDVPESTVGTLSGYKVDFAARIGNDIYYVVRTGATESPIVDHGAIVLDIDIFKTSDLPQKDEDVLGCIDELRLQKNILFESFITDKSRELFNRKI